MLMIVLLVSFFGVIAAMVVRRRNIGRLSSFATLLAAIMAMLWMQDRGLLPDVGRPIGPGSPAATAPVPAH